MRHAPFGRPRHPLGTFPCGKVPRPPAGGRNLPQETDFLWMARKSPSLLLPFYGGFRLCGGDQRAFRSPFGNLRPLCSKGVAQKTDSLWKARERPSLLLPFYGGFRLCGGDQRAFRSPFGNLRALAAKGWRKKTDSLWKAREKLFLAFSCLAGNFAPAGATRGLSARPLDPFGNGSIGEIQKYLTAHTRVRYFCIFPLFLPPDGRTVPAENVILPPHQGHESLSLR